MKKVFLIDYENVQKHDLRPLLEHDVLIKVFHNENQKFTSDFLNLALEFSKEKFELIKIRGAGKNAADFHIAYYIGRLSKEITGAEFHIISKDTGFKVLADFLTHLQGVPCMVRASIAEIGLLKQAPPMAKPVLPELKRHVLPPSTKVKVSSSVKPVAPLARTATPKTIEDWYSVVVEKIRSSKAQKLPHTKKKLQHHIVNNFCNRKTKENDADMIIQRLVENRIIECNGERVIYR